MKNIQVGEDLFRFVYVHSPSTKIFMEELEIMNEMY